MGKLDSSMGFSVNEDGSITRTNSSLHNNQTPDFIPVSLSKFKGGFWKKLLYLVYFILILGVHGVVIGFSVEVYYSNKDIEHYLNEYEERLIAFHNHDITNSDYKNYSDGNRYDSYYSPEYAYHVYEDEKSRRMGFVIALAVTIILALFLDIKIVPKLLRNYPNKKRILKCAKYVQTNLKFNYGFPYIMTNNYIGVLNTHKKKVIIPPDYDVIYWVIPQNVLCAVKNDKQTFYDVNGKILTNVPSSYYNTILNG